MRELLEAVARWRAEGKQVAVATVAKTYGSAPVPLGSKLAVSSAGEMVGSVSGGCVESAVVQEALACLETGRPKLITYGIADELAQSVGLACGGVIDIFVEAPFTGIDPQTAAAFAQFEADVRAGRLAALVTVLSGPQMGSKLLLGLNGRAAGGLGSPELEQSILSQAAELFDGRQAARLTVTTAAGPVEVLVDIQIPTARLYIVGAVHTAAALVSYANVLGYRTIVLDSRTAFATPQRFGHASALITRWPADVLAAEGLDEGSCVVALTHDAKIDNPALAVALNSPARYVGALGSRKTHAKRIAALKELGLSDAQLARIHAPIGLDIGARRPEEIALSIMAEIVAVMNGKFDNLSTDR